MDLREAKQTFYFSEGRKILLLTWEAHLSEPESCMNEPEHTQVLRCTAREQNCTPRCTCNFRGFPQFWVTLKNRQVTQHWSENKAEWLISGDEMNGSRAKWSKILGSTKKGEQNRSEWEFPEPSWKNEAYWNDMEPSAELCEANLSWPLTYVKLETP